MKTNMKNFSAFAIAAALAGFTLSAQPEATEFVPFKDFLMQTRRTNMSAMIAPETRVRESAAFEEMRAHILKVYEGVAVNHSFVADSAHFDCIPVDQQPAARLFGAKKAEEPPASLLAKSATTNSIGAGEGVTQQASHQRMEMDSLGNSTTCEADTIPMRRLTLEEMSRFSSLHEFFQKSRALPADASAGHKYAVMTESVPNLGAATTLNVWNPYANKNLSQMSLSQQWVIGGSGNARQTAEVGWQVQPSAWGTQNTILFIYYTADNYQSTGCYNLTCGVFFQQSRAVTFGASLTASTIGGPQYEVTAQYLLYNGNWWLSINGNWIGYFPGSAYKGGAMTRQADTIEFGTESAGNNQWPAEGSGYWAESGFAYAAYQRNPFYTDLAGNGQWASDLQQYLPSTSCYDTTELITSSSPDWALFFYVGGPGGSPCN